MASPAKAVAVPLVALNPTEAENLFKEYRDLEEKIEAIETKAADDTAPLITRRDSIWDELVAQVRRFGSQHAEKSKLLHGLTLEAMGTFGTSMAIDAAAVEVFRLALVKAKQSRLLKRIFEKTVRFTLLPQAAAFLRAEHDRGKFPDKLFLLFARCTVPKELPPRLEVREKT